MFRCRKTIQIFPARTRFNVPDYSHVLRDFERKINFENITSKVLKIKKAVYIYNDNSINVRLVDVNKLCIINSSYYINKRYTFVRTSTRKNLVLYTTYPNMHCSIIMESNRILRYFLSVSFFNTHRRFRPIPTK